MLMSKPIHEPYDQAWEDHSVLIEGNWFTSAFGNVLITFILLLWLTMEGKSMEIRKTLFLTT